MATKHVILLSVDCLRADRLGCYGYERNTTPNIDKLADNGIRWSRCYSTGPRTNESFPGIVAAALSTDSGYAGDAWHRTPPEPSIGSWLSDLGYDTAARLANPQLAAMKEYDRGINSFRNLAVGSVGWGVSENNTSNGAEFNPTSFTDKLQSKVRNFRDGLRNSGIISRQLFYTPMFCAYREYQRRDDWPTIDGKKVAAKLIKTLPQSENIDQPLFRWAHFNDIHAPIHPDRVNDSTLESMPKIYQYFGDIERIRQEPSQKYERMYDATIKYIDRRIGEVVDELKRNELWEDSVLIVTADHGEALYDRGMHGHASGNDRYLYDETRDYMYDELLHVPLICAGGAVNQTKTVTAPFSTAWLNELVAEVAGLPQGEFVRSSGLDSVFSETQPRVVLSDALTDKGHTFSATNGEYKLITRSLSPGDDILSDAYLFDLTKDPKEQSPIDVDKAPTSLVEAINGNVRTLEDLPDTSRGRQVSDQTKERLSQMGYTE
ncbi:sulfatase-like hydrolase/transferase [Halomicrococcus sp. NG-SE-24]|uniref:sulfatase-like hydrolase/transferase n=1 Tax=Halomicrococcus sp. NG-SE-24 TaxID=3436928 RepID=UPI003D95B315